MKSKMEHITSIAVIKKKSKMRDRDLFFLLRNTNQYKSFKSNFSRQKNVLYVKKLIVDRSIIHFKKKVIQLKNLKINIFIYESNWISIKTYTTELSNMKTKILMKRFNFSIRWSLILKHITQILIDSKTLN